MLRKPVGDCTVFLCSYTKGRSYLVVKHVAEENGVEAYRMLMKEYQPTNRAKSLELFHNILNYRFAQSKGIAENILEYEVRIEQDEKATGEKVQENLKVSTRFVATVLYPSE